MKTVKTNDCITKSELIKRGWAEEKIDMYLFNVLSPTTRALLGVSDNFGKNVYSKSKAIDMENYLTKMGIDWRMKV